MNRISTAIVTLFAALTITGCAAMDEGPVIDSAGEPGFTVATDGRDAPSGMELIYVEEAPDGVCGCTTKDCISDWISENLGCGVCMDAVCGEGEFVGGCVACPEEGPAIGAPRPRETSVDMQ